MQGAAPLPESCVGRPLATVVRVVPCEHRNASAARLFAERIFCPVLSCPVVAAREWSGEVWARNTRLRTPGCRNCRSTGLRHARSMRALATVCRKRRVIPEQRVPEQKHQRLRSREGGRRASRPDRRHHPRGVPASRPWFTAKGDVTTRVLHQGMSREAVEGLAHAPRVFHTPGYGIIAFGPSRYLCSFGVSSVGPIGSTRFPDGSHATGSNAVIRGFAVLLHRWPSRAPDGTNSMLMITTITTTRALPTFRGRLTHAHIRKITSFSGYLRYDTAHGTPEIPCQCIHPSILEGVRVATLHTRHRHSERAHVRASARGGCGLMTDSSDRNST